MLNLSWIKTPRLLVKQVILAALVVVVGCSQDGPDAHNPAQPVQSSVKTASNPSFTPAATSAQQLTDTSSEKAGSGIAAAMNTEAWRDLQQATQAKLNPLADGWESEAKAEAIDRELAGLVKVLSTPRQIAASDLQISLADDFCCTTLRPGDLQEILRDKTVVVSRAANLDATTPEEFKGAAGLQQALQDLVAPFVNADRFYVRFKTVKVQLKGPLTAGEHIFHLIGYFGDSTIEQHATWQCEWIETEQGRPQLKSIRLDDFEEVYGYSESGTWFADCTESVAGGNSSYKDQLSYGTNFWMARIEKRLGMDFYGHQGLAVGDVNGDGLEDVYVCQPGGLPNCLLIQQSDGTVVDKSVESGVDFLDASSSALLIDVDNDGDQDLALAAVAEVTILMNDGSGQFSRGRDLPRATTTGANSLCAADYDSDGDLDIYVCRYVGTGGQLDVAESAEGNASFYDANIGLANVLLQNDGSGQFTDVTQQVGLDQNNRRFSFVAIWEDFDNDGDPDLYVANDFGRNNLYRNTNGHFVDDAANIGVEDMAAGMGVTCGDYNRDGNIDIYVGNMYSAAGSRITSQQDFKSQDSNETRTRIQRFARGNSLYENLGVQDGSTTLQFRDVSDAAAVTRGRWAWATLFVDFNNDGWEDLLVTNGMVTNKNSKDL